MYRFLITVSSRFKVSSCDGILSLMYLYCEDSFFRDAIILVTVDWLCRKCDWLVMPSLMCYKLSVSCYRCSPVSRKRGRLLGLLAWWNGGLFAVSLLTCSLKALSTLTYSFTSSILPFFSSYPSNLTFGDAHDSS